MQVDSQITIVGGNSNDPYKLVKSKDNEWVVYQKSGRLGKPWEVMEIIKLDNTDYLKGGRTELILWLLERVANGSSKLC